MTKPGCEPKLLWLRSSFHVCISKLLAKRVPSFIHFLTWAPSSWPRSPCHDWCWGKERWIRRSSAAKNQTVSRAWDSWLIRGVPRARLSGVGFCALSQSNENCWITNDDGGTACSTACKTQGAALSPQLPLPSALLNETVESWAISGRRRSDRQRSP